MHLCHRIQQPLHSHFERPNEHFLMDLLVACQSFCASNDSTSSISFLCRYVHCLYYHSIKLKLNGCFVAQSEVAEFTSPYNHCLSSILKYAENDSRWRHMHTLYCNILGGREEWGERRKSHTETIFLTYCSLIHDGCAIADPDCANAFSLRWRIHWTSSGSIQSK